MLKKAMAAAGHEARSTPRAEMPQGDLLGASKAMRELMQLIARAARGTATVLIRGESGTGKELIARAIHAQGPRSSRQLVKIHCAALPESLLESELFGYEKGAFTGAAARKPGRVELAQGGTLFLDEIGDVPLGMQVKLLRVLQERELTRLGGTQTIKVDVRVVAATHRDLEAMVNNGQFREDLLYRLAVLPLFIPPLRARREDIDELAHRFCALHGEANGRPDAALSRAAVDILREQPWPGNVRQLQNFVERLIVLSDGPLIGEDDVRRELAREGALLGSAPPAGASRSSDEHPATLESRRREAEKRAISAALESAMHNRTLAARLLGVSRRTLYNKLEEHGLL